MKKNIVYRCSECEYETTGYFGRCPSCGSWGTLEEIKQTVKVAGKITRDEKSTSKKLDEIDIKNESRIITDIGELNRVLGNGLVRDSVIILTAKPGAGKSTLLLQLSDDIAKLGLKVLYVTGEESDTQIRDRADRLGVKSENIWILNTNSINDCEIEIERVNPDLMIFDSIQTMADDNLSQKMGSPTQVMEVANKIVSLSKNSTKKRASFIVGQMTKADELAGVRTLEHLVDAVLVLDSEITEQLRVLYSTKNRYGNTGEVGFFEMTENGLISIDNPSEYFISQDSDSYGKALSVLRQGSRYVIAEIESLVSKSFFPYPQRLSETMKRDSFNIIASILDEIASINLEDKNIILKSTGGLKIEDVAADLSIAMSILSSYFKIALPNDVVFVGELGLTGDIKKVQNIKGRINEAKRLGYKKIIISKNQSSDVLADEIEILGVSNINDVVRLFFK